jgi:hypothetical protein
VALHVHKKIQVELKLNRITYIYKKQNKKKLTEIRAGAELGFKNWGGQIEKKNFERAKTIKITKFRGKIN